MAIPVFGAVDTIIAGGGTGTAKLGGMLNVNTTQYSTPADTDEHDAITYPLPADTLNGNGKMLRITAWGFTGATGDNKTVKVYFGASVVTQFAVQAMNNKIWRMQAEVIRTGVGAQISTGRSVNGTAANVITDIRNLPSEDETGAIVVKVTAQNAVANAADIVVEGMFIELLN